ncbi:MAG: hybrid sensor histidine kinase/response regulator [Anaerolineae bacterium]|nr:hybrid sensor histidine kinase/response regulator [Anaerolineae bacterium]MDW8100304.1 hybrid sensor histidine kinase/response regulator [Anaerolineae bacterium]
MELTKEAFAEQVKEALSHLYDVAYLPRLELTYLLTGDGNLSWNERAQALRHILIQAIERLDPGETLSLRARERRSYAILFGRYARSMTSQDVMEELAISERQYWREHRKAVEALVDLLWEEYRRREQSLPEFISLEEEEEAIACAEADLMVAHSSPEEVNVEEIIHQVTCTLQPVMRSKRAQLTIDMLNLPLLAFVNRAILRQICLNLLSYAIDAAVDGIVSLQLRGLPETVQLTITTTTQPDRENPARRIGLGLKIVQRLIKAQNGQIHIQVDELGQWSATVDFPRAQCTPILVIDDNRAIINLFQRYLAGSKYRVVGAETGQRALQLAIQIRPAIITLDVMMPNQDGWETLQALKAIPELRDIPLIVCSILNEPELAYSLGANDFIRKPVSRTMLLQALDYWLSHSNLMAPRHPRGPEDI